MKLYKLIILTSFCSNCTNDSTEKVSITVDGLFNPLEIGLDSSYKNLNENRYFSVYLVNNDSLPLTLATTGEEKFYSPTSTEYSYFSKKYKARKKGRGRSDFFSSEKTIIPPFKSRKFYFYASISPNTDTVDFFFEYMKADSICFIETSYFLKNDKVVSEISAKLYCK